MRQFTTPGGIYMVSQVKAGDGSDWAELLTQQRSPLTGSKSWEVARNPFSGTFEEVKAEAFRREALIQRSRPSKRNG